MKNEQLLLKTLCSGLPYGLKAVMLNSKIDYVGKLIDQIEGIYLLKDIWHCETYGGSRPSIDNVKPILYDLSYLTKPIWHKGDEFTPNEKLHKYLLGNDYGGLSYEGLVAVMKCVKTSHLPLITIEKLNEWHFDIYGLIDLGLAVSVDTLKENPYK